MRRILPSFVIRYWSFGIVRFAMADPHPNVVPASTVNPKLADGIVDLDAIKEPGQINGCRVFTHYNGPTDQLDGLCVGMCVVDPGASPHPPHQHPEEEFMIVASGTGEIVCGDTVTEVGPGAVMYCAGDVLHGITNTGKVPMTFYWSKWLGKGARA
jgi:mannose-6-phosphate isomerase-like protein (cupin superfamily)